MQTSTSTIKNLEMAILADKQGNYSKALELANLVLQDTVACPAAWLIKANAYSNFEKGVEDFFGSLRDCWYNAYMYAQPEEKQAVLRMIENSIDRAGVLYLADFCKKGDSTQLEAQQKLNKFENALGTLCRDLGVGINAFEKTTDHVIDMICRLADIIRNIPYPTNDLGRLMFVLGTGKIAAGITVTAHMFFHPATIAQRERLIKNAESLARHTRDNNLSSYADTYRIKSLTGRKKYAERVAASLTMQWKPQLLKQLKDTYWEEHKKERAELEQRIEAQKVELQNVKNELSNLPSHAKKNEIEKTISEKRNMLLKLSFFKWKDKKALNSEIEVLNQQRTVILRSLDQEKRETEQRLQKIEENIRHTKGLLENPAVEVDDRMEPIVRLQDGLLTDSFNKLIQKLKFAFQNEFFFGEPEKVLDEQIHGAALLSSSISVYAINENGEKGTHLLEIKCKFDHINEPVKEISLIVHDYSSQEGNDAPEKMLPIVAFLSKFACYLCPSLGREKSQTIFAEVLATYKEESTVIDDFSFEYKHLSSENVRITIKPSILKNDKIINELEELTTSQLAPDTEMLHELGVRALNAHNLEDAFRYGEMLLKKNEYDVLGMELLAAGWGWNSRKNEIAHICKSYFLNVLRRKEITDEVFIRVQTVLGVIGGFRMNAAYHSFRSGISKDSAEKINKVAHDFHQFCFSVEAEAGRTLDANKVLSPAGEILIAAYEYAARKLSEEKYTASPTKLEEANTNNRLVSIISVLSSNAWINNPECMVGTNQLRKMLEASGKMEKHVEAKATPCKDAAERLSYSNLDELQKKGIEIGLALCKDHQLEDRYSTLLNNWNQSFTIDQLAAAVNSLLPSGYHLKKDGLPSSVINGETPFRQQRFDLRFTDSEGNEKSTDFSIAGESCAEGLPVYAVSVEGNLKVVGNVTTSTDVGCYAMLCAQVLKCLCPSLDTKDAVKYGASILCGNSENATIQNVQLDTHYSIGFMGCPAKMHLTKCKTFSENT